MNVKNVFTSFFCVFAVAASLMMIAFCANGCCPTIRTYPTAKQYEKQLTEQINKDLVSEDHPIRKYVEKSHRSVDVKTAHVSKLKVYLKEGSRDIGKDGSNIQKIEVEITTIWDGKIHKDGKTVVETEITVSGGKVNHTKPKIVYTDAVVTVNVDFDPGNAWKVVLSKILFGK